MDINEKLNIISFKNQQKLSMNSNQTKDSTINNLYNQMKDAEENVKLAPLEAAKAKQKYYHFIGEKDHQIELDANTFGNQISEKHYTIYNSTQQSSEYYESQYKFLFNLDNILFEHYKKILKKLNTLKNDFFQSNTNERKVYYINEELSTIDAWSNLLFIIQIYIAYKIIELYIQDSYHNLLDNPYYYIFMLLFIIFMMTPFFYTFWVWLFNIIGYVIYLKPFTYTHL